MEDFYGRSQLRPGVWDANDAEWGKAMVEHYHNHTNNPTTCCIPKIMHFIWLGPAPINDTAPMDSWRQHHTNWEVRLWRDQDLQSCSFYNKEALDFCMQHGHYGMASDIVRLELLHTYGGVYVDTDYQCVESLDELHCGGFYCGASNVGCVEVNNGLMGSRPGGAIVQMLRESIHEWFRVHGRPLATIASFAGMSPLTDMDVCRHTGPGLLTTTLGRLMLQQDMPEEIMIYPCGVFHPMPNVDRDCQLTHQEVIEQYSIPGTTRAIHLWHCSWQNR